MRLENKVIIVTGSTTGIGKAIAIKAVSEGAKVIIHGLEEALGNEVLKEIGEDKAVLHIEDISNEGAPGRLVALAIKKFGKLDAVVNNAATVVSSNIHTTDIVFFSKSTGSEFACALCIDKSSPATTHCHTWLRFEYWISKCIQRRTQPFCLQRIERCVNDDVKKPG